MGGKEELSWKEISWNNLGNLNSQLQAKEAEQWELIPVSCYSLLNTHTGEKWNYESQEVKAGTSVSPLTLTCPQSFSPSFAGFGASPATHQTLYCSPPPHTHHTHMVCLPPPVAPSLNVAILCKAFSDHSYLKLEYNTPILKVPTSALIFLIKPSPHLLIHLLFMSSHYNIRSLWEYSVI